MTFPAVISENRYFTYIEMLKNAGISDFFRAIQPNTLETWIFYVSTPAALYAIISDHPELNLAKQQNKLLDLGIISGKLSPPG